MPFLHKLFQFPVQPTNRQTDNIIIIAIDTFNVFCKCALNRIATCFVSPFVLDFICIPYLTSRLGGWSNMVYTSPTTSLLLLYTTLRMQKHLF